MEDLSLEELLEKKNATPPLNMADYLRNLGERLRYIPVMHGVDESDTDRLRQIARFVECKKKP